MNRSPHAALLTSVALALALTAADATAMAGEFPDVVVHDPAPPHRLVVVEWNPLPLVTIGKLSANAVLTPGDHHAFVLSPFYAWTTTAPIDAVDGAGNHTKLPEQEFSGFGAELGYRYYLGAGGARGMFLGPSLILGSFAARAQDGSKTPYLEYGVAADVGYQALVADRLSLSLGAGLQLAAPSKSIPDQQFPAWIYANRRVSPRLLFSIGWAL